MKITTLPRRTKKTELDFSFAIVNIVLLLILFFLATGQLMNAPSRSVELSQTTKLEIGNLLSPVLIVASNGVLELDGKPIEPDQLANALAEKTTLFVMIEGEAPALELLKVLTYPGVDQLEVKLVTAHTNGAEP